MRIQKLFVSCILVLTALNPALSFAIPPLTTLGLCGEELSKLEFFDKRLRVQEIYSKMDSIEDFSEAQIGAFEALVKTIDDPQQGLLAKILIARNAKHTLDVGTYIFGRDPAAYMLLEEVKHALENGVTVRVLIDSLGSIHPTHSELKALLGVQGGFIKDKEGNYVLNSNPKGLEQYQRSTVEVRVFNPIINFKARLASLLEKINLIIPMPLLETVPFKRWYNRRSHDKIWAADLDFPELAVAVVGGRNLKDVYYGVPHVDAKTFNDMEIIIRNNMAKAGPHHLGNTLGDYYDKLFYHLGNKILSNVFFGIHRNYPTQRYRMRSAYGKYLKPGTELGDKLTQMVETDYTEISNSDFSQEKALFVNQIENLSNHHVWRDEDPSEDKENRKNGNSIIPNLRGALYQIDEDHFVLVSPYLRLTSHEMHNLHEWLKGKSTRQLDIVTNSISSTDNLLAQTIVDMEFAPALKKEMDDVSRQVNLYALGKEDDVKDGGTQSYGKLHAKFSVYGIKGGAVLTFNGDDRSRLENSELGFIFWGGTTGSRLSQHAQGLIAKSYKWGSPEWQKVRELPRNQKKVRLQPYIYRLLQRFGFLAKLI